MTGANRSEGTDIPTGRETHLDGLRGLAALLVVVVHGIVTFDFALFSGNADDGRYAWDVPVSGAPFLVPLAGNLAVCVFFALSGYVLSRSFCATGLGSIALLFKRYARFTPPILAACLVSYALLAAGLMANHPLAALTKSGWLAFQMRQAPSLSQALQDGLYRALTATTPTRMPYDPPLWTMRIEFWGSVTLIAALCLPGLRALSAATRGRSRIVTLAALGVLGCTSFLGLFAFGALLNLTQLHRKVGSRTAAALLVAGLFLGTIPYSAAPWGIVRPFVTGDVPGASWIPLPHTAISFWHSVGAMLVLIAANSCVPFRAMLSTRAFQLLGRISYPLYLIHFPLLMSAVCSGALAMLHHGLPYLWTAALSAALLLSLSLSAATALFFICERPSITLSGRVGRITDALVRRVLALFLRRAPAAPRVEKEPQASS